MVSSAFRWTYNCVLSVFVPVAVSSSSIAVIFYAMYHGFDYSLLGCIINLCVKSNHASSLL